MGDGRENDEIVQNMYILDVALVAKSLLGLLHLRDHFELGTREIMMVTLQ